MRASTTYPSNGSKVTKIAIVTMLHLGVALALINMKMVIKDPLKSKPVDVTFKKQIIVEPEPVEQEMETKKLDPTIFVPKTIVDVEPDPAAPTAKPLPPGPVIVDQGEHIKIGPETVKGAPDAKKTIFKPATDGECARPDYPPRAARLGESGTVTLALLIGTDGKVSDAKVSSSSGSRELDRAAIAALSLCKFKPATTNGVAEPAWGKIAYAWTLE
jgi:protein TonB